MVDNYTDKYILDCLKRDREHTWFAELVRFGEVTYEFCRRIVALDRYSIAYVPDVYLTPEICYIAVKSNPFSYKCIPFKNRTPMLRYLAELKIQLAKTNRYDDIEKVNKILDIQIRKYRNYRKRSPLLYLHSDLDSE